MERKNILAGAFYQLAMYILDWYVQNTCCCQFGLTNYENPNHTYVCISRYSAIRKQFGPTPDEEISVIEYQLQVSVYVCMYVGTYVWCLHNIQNVFINNDKISTIKLIYSIFVYFWFQLHCVSLTKVILFLFLLLFLAMAFVAVSVCNICHGNFILRPEWWLRTISSCNGGWWKE